MWICAYCRGDKVLSCAAGRWGERWRRSATCRSALRTSLPSEHLLSESWRQHCGACQLLLPHKPPCMQNRLRLPSLLGHAVSTSPPPFLSVTNKQTCLYSAPPTRVSQSLHSIQFPAVKCAPKRRQATETILGEGALQGQRAIKKTKKNSKRIVDFYFKQLSRREAHKFISQINKMKMSCFALVLQLNSGRGWRRWPALWLFTFFF